MTLTTTTLDVCLQGIITHRNSEAYAILGQGMYLLQARTIYALPSEGRGQGRKSSATVALDLEADNEGFDQWLLENITGPDSGLRMSRRTAFNYMRAASAMGLTGSSTEEDLLALKEANAMAEKRLTDLYKPAALPDSSKPATPAAPGDPAQLWFDFEAELSANFAPESPQVKALYLLPVAKREAIETELRTALDVVRTVNQSLKK
jgi:hypothetical protein